MTFFNINIILLTSTSRATRVERIRQSMRTQVWTLNDWLTYGLSPFTLACFAFSRPGVAFDIFSPFVAALWNYSKL